MSCYHPLFSVLCTYVDVNTGEIIKQNHIEQKVNTSLKNVDDYNIEFDEFCCRHPAQTFDLKDERIWFDKKNKRSLKIMKSEPIKLPCGRCIGCKLDYSREWANRCMLELDSSKENYFLTLTYDDRHLPYKEQIEPITGVKVSKPTLYPRHMQLFLKRLRKRFPDSTIRFFGCGEYGEKNHRPHYHLILFNCPLGDSMHYFKSFRGYQYFISDVINDLWTSTDLETDGESLGYHLITNVTWDTCAYVARYCLKKAKGDDYFKYASDNDVEKEFIRMSRRPGIGREYFERHKDKIYEVDQISEGFKSPIKPPKYYDRLFDVEHHFELEDIKNHRKDLMSFAHDPESDLNEFEYNRLLERTKQSVVGRLPRNFETL